MINTITIYDIKTQNKNDVEILRELAKKTYANCRKITTEETYELNERDNKCFYGFDKFQLGKLENVLFESANILKMNITYKPQIKQLEEIMKDLTCDSEVNYKPHMVEMVINNDAYQYFKEDEEELDEHYEEPIYHMEYIIKKFKKMVNVICKVLNDNELKEQLYR